MCWYLKLYILYQFQEQRSLIYYYRTIYIIIYESRNILIGYFVKKTFFSSRLKSFKTFISLFTDQKPYLNGSFMRLFLILSIVSIRVSRTMTILTKWI